MELLDIFYTITAALKEFGRVSGHYWLEIGGGLIALILLAMKVYKYGRDNLLKKVRRFMLGEEGFWDRPPRRNIARHIDCLKSSIPILLIANFKGGVGKSTLAAHLAAFYDASGLRVLLIDLDYQGTLTDAVISRDIKPGLGAIELIEPRSSLEAILAKTDKPFIEFQRTQIFTSHYTLNRVENRVLFNWLIGQTRSDIRYNLHRVLSSKLVQQSYDIVIIDAPPRLMTATVNAICASTHVLIPTILDELSANATVNTIDAILKLKNKISPHLSIVGVVPTFVEQTQGLRPRERRVLVNLKNQIETRFNKATDVSIKIMDQRIVRKAAIASAAGQSVAFFHDADVRSMFTRLGSELAEALGQTFLRKLEHESARIAREVDQASDNVVQLGL